MISVPQIQRLVQLGMFRRLVERLLSAGRCRSRQAKERLTEPECLLPAAIGLALLRCCELSYSPSETAEDLAGRLLRMRRPDGLFGGGARPAAGASAVALRALLAWRDSCDAAGIRSAEVDEAIHHALSGLTARQECDGMVAGDAIDFAIALSMLGDRPEFRQMIDARRLQRQIDQSSSVDVDLTRYAHAMAA